MAQGLLHDCRASLHRAALPFLILLIGFGLLPVAAFSDEVTDWTGA